MTMRPATAFLLAALLAPHLGAHAQSSPVTASSILSPALGTLRQSLSGLRLDKWKAPKPLREETTNNIASMTRDLDNTLPTLLATADAAPEAVSQNLPVFRNIDALYDVLLRVVETADLAAPEGEANTLHQAMSSLEDARRTLGDSMENAASAQEKQLGALQAQSHSQTTPARAAGTVVNDSGKTTPASTHKHKPAPQ